MSTFNYCPIVGPTTSTGFNFAVIRGANLGYLECQYQGPGNREDILKCFYDGSGDLIARASAAGWCVILRAATTELARSQTTSSETPEGTVLSPFPCASTRFLRQA